MIRNLRGFVEKKRLSLFFDDDANRRFAIGNFIVNQSATSSFLQIMAIRSLNRNTKFVSEEVLREILLSCSPSTVKKLQLEKGRGNFIAWAKWIEGRTFVDSESMDEYLKEIDKQICNEKKQIKKKNGGKEKEDSNLEQ